MRVAGRQELEVVARRFFAHGSFSHPCICSQDVAAWSLDCLPRSSLQAFVHDLLAKVVAPAGRLILGAYGNRSRGEVPARIDALLGQLGYAVVGTASGGLPEMARFAWIDA